MKRSSMLVCAFFVVGIVLGQVNPLLAGESKHDFSAEVVSVDLEAKTITFKDTEGEETTMRVMDDAVETLETLAAGEKVILTCQDDENGEHMGIVAIETERTNKDEG